MESRDSQHSDPKMMESGSFNKTLDFNTIKENFYNSLEEADTLIDYFCIVGLDQVRV